MRALIFVFLLALAGCAATPRTPEPVIVTKTVQVVVTQRCKLPVINEPELELDKLKRGVDAEQLLRMYAIDEVSLKQQIKELKAALAGCATNPETLK